MGFSTLDQPILGSAVQHTGLQTFTFCYGLFTRTDFQRSIINYGTSKMNRLIFLACGISLLMGPHSSLAQHRGGHGAGTTGTRGGASSTDDLKDFKRAMALQASPDQVDQFRRLTVSTQAVRKSAQDLVKLAENASKSDLLLATNHVASELDTAQVDNQRFLRTFSGVQKSELKEVTKKLSKANSDVTKESKDLTREVERSQITGKQISGIAEKLDVALSDLQARQLAIGNEMGIQSEAGSQ
jgi:hypothetical protein